VASDDDEIRLMIKEALTEGPADIQTLARRLALGGVTPIEQLLPRPSRR